MKCCPTCKANADQGDIRQIFANKIVIVENFEEEAIKSKLQELSRQIENLKALGVEYVECEVCDQPFLNIDEKNIHLKEIHNF